MEIGDVGAFFRCLRIDMLLDNPIDKEYLHIYNSLESYLGNLYDSTDGAIHYISNGGSNPLMIYLDGNIKIECKSEFYKRLKESLNCSMNVLEQLVIYYLKFKYGFFRERDINYFLINDNYAYKSIFSNKDKIIW